MRLSEHGLLIGDALLNWKAPPRITHTTLTGRFCRIEPLNAAKHAADLHAANSLDATGEGWTYLASGPFANFADYQTWAQKSEASVDPAFHALIDLTTQKPVGVAAYMRIDAEHGVVEIGNLRFSPLMQRTPVSTEAMYLMMKHVFTLGYRRYEWKCDTFNAPSRRAAQRFGFSYEGVFRQATTYKNRTRDTAWYSIIDGEFPAIDAAFTQWLAPENFDAQGKQRVALSALTGPLLKARG